ncbi:MAG TPA: carbohydrate-binding family 9-like protein [Thermoanaerobaculia bacterium]
MRVGFRDGSLLVRFDGRDDGTVATLTRRDDPLWTEDVFEVFVTPLDPPVVYFEFEVNPLGTLFDARVTSPDLARATMNLDVAWNLPGLRATSRVRPGLWSATLRIPLAPMLGDVSALTPSLSRGEREDARHRRPWRANFYRVDRGERDEFSAWSSTGKEPADFHEAVRFGRLTLPI